MKRIISLTIILLLFSRVLICQQNDTKMLSGDQLSLAGYWNGKIKAGSMSFTFSIRLWINDGSLRGSLDSPEQDLKNIPVDEIIINNDGIEISGTLTIPEGNDIRIF